MVMYKTVPTLLLQLLAYSRMFNCIQASPTQVRRGFFRGLWGSKFSKYGMQISVLILLHKMEYSTYTIGRYPYKLRRFPIRTNRHILFPSPHFYRRDRTERETQTSHTHAIKKRREKKSVKKSRQHRRRRGGTSFPNRRRVGPRRCLLLLLPLRSKSQARNRGIGGLSDQRGGGEQNFSVRTFLSEKFTEKWSDTLPSPPFFFNF